MSDAAVTILATAVGGLLGFAGSIAVMLVQDRRRRRDEQTAVAAELATAALEAQHALETVVAHQSWRQVVVPVLEIVASLSAGPVPMGARVAYGARVIREDLGSGSRLLFAVSPQLLRFAVTAGRFYVIAADQVLLRAASEVVQAVEASQKVVGSSTFYRQRTRERQSAAERVREASSALLAAAKEPRRGRIRRLIAALGALASRAYQRVTSRTRASKASSAGSVKSASGPAPSRIR